MKIVITFLICLTLSACTAPTGSLPATLTLPPPATLIPDTVTPTVLPTPPQPSATDTATPLPTLTPTFTHVPYLTSDYNKRQAILEAKQTEQSFYLPATPFSNFPVACNEINQHFNLQSPAENWLALRCDDTSNPGLEVVSKGGSHWVLQFKDFLSKEFVEEDGSTPIGGLYPEHWTGDEKYLYFTSRVNISGGGPCFYGEHTDGLYRINVNDGTVAPQLEPSSGNFYDIAFSTDGRRYAYESNRRIPEVVDLKTGEAFPIEANGGVGDLTWSPDGSQLAYGICSAHLDDTIAEKSSIKVFSVVTRTSKTILEVQQALLRIESYDGDQVLRIARDGADGWESDYMFFDWDSAQLVTPTPKP